MEHFLINSSICMFSLWLVYKLLLENTSWHQWKRFYLLGSLIISVIIPFVVVRTVVIPLEATSSIDFSQFEVMEETAVATGIELSWTAILLSVYVLGVVLMAFRLVRNLYGLRIKPTDQIESYKDYKLVLRKLVEIPHSFYDKIYASVTNYKAGKIPEAVLDHEKAHLDQRHSWDILLLEFLIVLMWFNPLLYLIKYSIKLNHEFLADQAVISAGADTQTYQETLLAYAAGSQHRSLANTFNFPLIKKRFTIMKTNTTNTSGLLRSLAIIPVLALLVISCGQEEIIEEPVLIEIVEEPEVIEVFEDDSNVPIVKIIVVDRSLPTGNLTIDGKSYRYEINGDNVDLFDLQGKKQDLKSQDYKIMFSDEIEEVEVVEVPIEENSSEPKTLLEYIEKNKSNLVYYLDDKRISETEAIKNIEVLGQSGVRISNEQNGKKAINIKMSKSRIMNMPPPAPPSNETTKQKIENGSLKILVDGKKATQDQLDYLESLEEDFEKWKDIRIYPSQKEGVDIISFYGLDFK